MQFNTSVVKTGSCVPCLTYQPAPFALAHVNQPNLVKAEGMAPLCSRIRVLRRFSSFSDIIHWTLTAFKAVDDVRYFIWYQVALGLHQSGAESLLRVDAGPEGAPLSTVFLICRGQRHGLAVVAVKRLVYGLEGIFQ